MKNNDDCPVMNTYKLFTRYVKDNIPIEKAFYISVAQLVDESISDAVDEAFYEGMRCGFTDAMRAIAKQAEETAEAIDSKNDEHICEECKLEQEYTKCLNCDCEEDQCEVDIAKKIRRAVWEDEK